MADILTTIVPLFTIVFLGFVAGRRMSVFDETGAQKLTALVFYFAIPALAFRTVSGALADGGTPELRLLFAYYGAEVCVFAFAALTGWLVWRRSMAGCVVMGLSSTFSNGFYMALPITYALFGEAGVAQLLLILVLSRITLRPVDPKQLWGGANSKDRGNGSFVFNRCKRPGWKLNRNFKFD